MWNMGTFNDPWSSHENLQIFPSSNLFSQGQLICPDHWDGPVGTWTSSGFKQCLGGFEGRKMDGLRTKQVEFRGFSFPDLGRNMWIFVGLSCFMWIFHDSTMAQVCLSKNMWMNQTEPWKTMKQHIKHGLTIERGVYPFHKGKSDNPTGFNKLFNAGILQ